MQICTIKKIKTQVALRQSVTGKVVSTIIYSLFQMNLFVISSVAMSKSLKLLISIFPIGHFLVGTENILEPEIISG